VVGDGPNKRTNLGVYLQFLLVTNFNSTQDEPSKFICLMRGTIRNSAVSGIVRKRWHANRQATEKPTNNSCGGGASRLTSADIGATQWPPLSPLMNSGSRILWISSTHAHSAPSP